MSRCKLCNRELSKENALSSYLEENVQMINVIMTIEAEISLLRKKIEHNSSIVVPSPHFELKKFNNPHLSGSISTLRSKKKQAINYVKILSSYLSTLRDQRMLLDVQMQKVVMPPISDLEAYQAKKKSIKLDFLRMKKAKDICTKYFVSCESLSTYNDSKDISKVGISKIAGLPYPNSGIYQTLPLDIQCAIFHKIGEMCKQIASVLNIILPYPLVSEEDDRIFVYRRGLTLLDNNKLLIAPASINWSYVYQNTDLHVENFWNCNASGGWAMNESFEEAKILLERNVFMLASLMNIDSEKLWPLPAMLLNLNQVEKKIDSNLLLLKMKMSLINGMRDL